MRIRSFFTPAFLAVRACIYAFRLSTYHNEVSFDDMMASGRSHRSFSVLLCSFGKLLCPSLSLLLVELRNGTRKDGY